MRALAILAVASCYGQASPGSQAGHTPAPGEIAVTLADVGLEGDSLDRRVDPCVDFFQFACGGWLARGEIPADRASWSRWAEIDEHNKAGLRRLLEADTRGAGSDAVSAPLGDFYGACMDGATADRVGTAAIASLLATTTAVKDAATWRDAVLALHRIGIWVVFNDSVSPDYRNATRELLYLDSADLELPDRDYYVKPELAPKVAALRTHVARMLVLAGAPVATTARAADDVVAIETGLAKLTKTDVEYRDVKANYNPTDAASLATQVTSIDWPAYWRGLGIAPGDKLVIVTPNFFAQLDAVRAQFTYSQWASYFTYHVVSRLAFALGTATDEEDFTLQRALTGVTARPDRYKRCIDETRTALGELLGKQYSDAYFPAASKQKAIALVDAIAHAVSREVADEPWLSGTTKRRAQDKLAKLVHRIGYPENWRRYDFAVARGDFVGNELRAWAFETHRALARAGMPVDRGAWTMNTFTVNAYYDPQANNTALPAGILQPPLFRADRSQAVNFGGIGWVIAHELTHGFDDIGAQFDDVGNFEDWWLPADKEAFEAKKQCVVDQYASYEELPGKFVDGRHTIGENIADLGGVKAAFRAYREARAGATSHQIADGFTEDQQFFLAIGQGDCTKNRRDEIEHLLTVDSHAPAELRLTGPLRDLPEFAAAFHCAPNTPMHPSKTCSVW